MKYLKLWLVLIVIAGGFLRFFWLDKNPPSLNWDEVSHGYNAYSILKTGRDEWGFSWPTIFRAYGDYKLPAYIYVTAVSVKIFGLNEIGVRFPSALFGTFSIFLAYLLAKRLFREELPAVLSAFLLAISPWHIFLSRPAFEANLASLLVIAGAYLFISSLNGLTIAAPFSAVLFGLSLYSYNSARIFSPLIIVAICLIYRNSSKEFLRANKKIFWLSLGLFSLFFLPAAISLFSPSGQARFQWVSIIDSGVIDRINEQRAIHPGFVGKALYNKAVYGAVVFVRNFLSNLSPRYLFLRGGSNYQYNLPGKGIIYPIEAFLILIGIFYVFKNFSKPEAKLLFCWWLLALIPSAVTRDNPHVLRTILVIPVPQILSAVGLWRILEWKTKMDIKIPAIIVCLSCLFLFFNAFIADYFFGYRQKYAWSWQWGYKQVAAYIRENESRYDKIFFTKRYGEPHEFLLFYLEIDPQKYRGDISLIRYFKTNWYWVDRFDKYFFVNDWEIKQKIVCIKDEECLLITSPGNVSDQWSKVSGVNFPDGKPAFEIYETGR